MEPLSRSGPLVLAGFCLTIALVAVEFISAAADFAARFPIDFTWAEILINYQNGFVRRGLLGEIYFRLDGLVSVRTLAPVAVTVVYLATATWLVVLAFRIRTFAALLFVFAPTTILYPVHQQTAFARKDAFILLALALAVWVAVKAPRRWALALIMLTYAVAGLIVEVSWLYFPLAVAILLVRRGGAADESWERNTVALSALYFVACMTFIMLVGAFLRGSPKAIVATWAARYPDLAGKFFSPYFLRMSLADGLQFVARTTLWPRTVAGYAIGFALTAVPLVYLARELRPLRPVGSVVRFWVAVSFLVMLGSFVIGADWGRYGHLFALHTFVFLATTRAAPRSEPLAVPKTLRQAVTAAVFALALAAYALSWQLAIWVGNGKAPLRPGPLATWLAGAST